MKKEAILNSIIALTLILVLTLNVSALSINGMKINQISLSPDKSSLSKSQNSRNMDRDQLIRPKPSTITGTFVEEVYDDFKNNKTWSEYFVVDSQGKAHKLNSKNINFQSGDTISVEGSVSSGGEVTTSKISLVNKVNSRNTQTLGEQKLLVLLVNWADDNSTPISAREAYSRVFNPNNPKSLAYYVDEVSYGRASVKGNVYGWVTSEYTKSSLCSSEQFDAIADAVAKADPYVDFSKYEHLMIVSSDSTMCGSSATGVAEFITDEGPVALTRSKLSSFQHLGNTGTDIHEFGHQLGLRHANGWECGSVAVGEECQSINYRDTLSIMGFTAGKSHFNSFHKEQLGWFSSDEIKTITSGTYTITPLETKSNSNNKNNLGSEDLKMLKIPTASGYEYSIEFRRPILLDKNLPQTNGNIDYIYSGAIIHSNYIPNIHLGYDTQLIDNKPHADDSSDWDFADSVLEPNQKFQDFENNIEIKTLSFTDDNLTVCIDKINSC